MPNKIKLDHALYEQFQEVAQTSPKRLVGQLIIYIIEISFSVNRKSLKITFLENFLMSKSKRSVIFPISLSVALVFSSAVSANPKTAATVGAAAGGFVAGAAKEILSNSSDIDDLNIDVEINIEGDVILSRDAGAKIGSIELDSLDASKVEIETDIDIRGETNIGNGSTLKEASIELSGDYGSIDIDQQYERKGDIRLSDNSELSLGNISSK